MTKEQAIQLWKDNDVSKVTFEFNCGGDSMNETQVYIYNSADEEIECSELSDYFDDEVYHNVNFYVDSDGVYMGESGNVYITFGKEEEEEEEGFIYNKESEEEWCEQTPFTEKINLTDEEVEFIEKYVSNINANMSEDDININYKVDFIQTDELVALEEKLLEKVKNFFYNYNPNLDSMSDWHTMEIQDETLNKETKTIDIEMSFEHYVYKSV
jgi:hypothetical protein